MSDDQDTIGNAGEIIERFGGIRPMATKMGIPVTTVQGWKQRNAIPASRRDDIIRIASQNRIDLGELLLNIPANPSRPGEKFDAPRLDGSTRGERYETRMPQTSYARPLYFATLLMIMGAVIGGVVAIAPKVRSIAGQDEQVKQLQAELERERARNAQAAEEPGYGEMIEKNFSEMRHKVDELSKQAEGYGAALNDLKTGSMPERIAKLEGHVNSMIGQSNALGLSAMLQKVQAMQQSPEGSQALSGVVQAMLGEMGIQADAPAEDGAAAAEPGNGAIGAALEKLRLSDPDVAKTLEGVAPEDVKAAAMLIGLAQMRQSLARDNDSFDQDLALLKMTAAKDNPELQASIDRLAPQARQGILTPTGLSKEFRGLAGDIVTASLNGQDVSVKDRMKARLNDVIIVEKSGEQISGTQTQRTIAQAQKQLDAGNVEAAIATLQALDGPAADKAQPFINQAQSTVLATQVQQALGQGALRQLLGSGGLASGAGLQGGVGSLVTQIQGMLPGQGPQPLYLPAQAGH